MIILTGPLIALLLAFTFSETKLRLISRFLCLRIPTRSFVPSPVDPSPIVPSLVFPFPLSPFLRSAWLTMAKATKPKALKSPKRAHLESESSHTEGKKAGRPRRKTGAAEASDGEPEEPAAGALTLKIPGRIVWDKYPERTERLLDFLDTHPDVAIKLFGDSTQAAKSEGRNKLTAKSNKGVAYLQLADGIFSIDDDAAVRADFTTNPNKYAKAVDNYVTNT
jgi:hypothetical protein